jgi:hypothetical protein
VGIWGLAHGLTLSIRQKGKANVTKRGIAVNYFSLTVYI